MLTVKFMKYGPAEAEKPSYTAEISVVSAHRVHAEFKGLGTEVTVEQLSGQCDVVLVGQGDCQWNAAYVMNEAGKTVETIR